MAGEKMIKNLVFDLGNVLIEWNVEKILAYFEPKEERRQIVKQAIFDSGMWHKTDVGDMTLEEASNHVISQLDPSYKSVVKNIFYHWYEVVHVYHDLQEKIHSWSEMGYHIYILSTTCEVFYHIEKSGLLPIYPLLSGYIISSEVKVVKPQKEIYLELLKKYHLNAEESVFIDDIQLNLDTAAELGFSTILAKEEAENIEAMQEVLRTKGRYGAAD